jgi:hypothetical protein
VTFANHGVEEVAALIGGVVETRFSRNLRLKKVVVGLEFANELGLWAWDYGITVTVHSIETPSIVLTRARPRPMFRVAGVR